MEKLNLSKNDLKQLISDYGNEIFVTDVVSNAIQTLFNDEDENLIEFYNKNKFPLEIQKELISAKNVFYDWQNKENYISTFSNMLYLSVLLDFLKTNYGQPDFKFDGNRTYHNYLFKHKEMTFFLSSKTEYHANNKIKDKNLLIVFDFYKELMQTLINYAMKDENQSKFPEEVTLLTKAKELGQIDEKNQIVYLDKPLPTIKKFIKIT